MSKNCSGFLNENNIGFVVEYRGDFENEIDKVDYACGAVIDDNLAVISVQDQKLNLLRQEVPSIVFVEIPSLYILQDITPSDIENIAVVKHNPYLNLNGRGILIGVIDTGIDYLNQEFIREDDTTRIVRLWDQSVQNKGDNDLYIGTEYKEDDINKAIASYKAGGNPYDIVPSRDDIGHGTQMSSIIGARGYNKEIEGVASDCDFCIVKLLESPFLKKINKENGLNSIPIYNNTEVLAAIAYLKRLGEESQRPLVIYLGVGGQEGSHDGYNITSRYLTYTASKPGVIVVAGTGNLGDYEGHALGFVKNVNDVYSSELQLTKGMKRFVLYIWIQKPNRMSLNITAPSGENSGEFNAAIFSSETRKFYLTNTKVTVQCNDPESLTGHQVYILEFSDITSGIWKFNLKGLFITNGRVDIWLPGSGMVPEGSKFLNSISSNTLTIPSTAENIITTAYYDSLTGAKLNESGKGFNTNQWINPDISTLGTNILTTSLDGKSVSTVSGSSAATAIVAGCCALLLQWGIVEGNDLTLYSTKMTSLFIYAATREPNEEYPNEISGYGKMDLYNIFNIVGGNYRGNDLNNNIYREDKSKITYGNMYREEGYGENSIFFRLPAKFFNIRYIKYKWRIINNG